MSFNFDMNTGTKVDLRYCGVRREMIQHWPLHLTMLELLTIKMGLDSFNVYVFGKLDRQRTSYIESLH